MKSSLVVLILVFAAQAAFTSLRGDSSEDQKKKQERDVRQPPKAPEQPRAAVEQRQKVESLRKGVEQKDRNRTLKIPDQPQQAVDQRAKNVESLRRGADQRDRRPEQQQAITPRSPSMSRSAVSPRPPKTVESSPQQNREAIKKQFQQFSDQRRDGRTITPDHARKAEDFRSSFRREAQDHRKASQEVTSRVKRNYPNYRHWFDDNFFRNRRGYPRYWHNNINWWGRPHWPRIYQWLGWAPTIYPIYYHYGSPVRIENYYPEAYTQPLADDNSKEWLPLGVFAVGADEAQAANANAFMQLVINQKGEIGGTYYNTSTNQAYPMDGVIDQESQQAFWRLTEDITAPVMMTGIYNLTQDVVDVQLTFPNGEIQYWALVRIE